METEVKLAFENPEELFAITKADWFTNFCMDASLKEPCTLENTYFDTIDRKLNSKGASIRVRYYEDSDSDDCYEHTVKYGGNVENGLHQRYEWNVKTSEKKFNIEKFKMLSSEADDPNELLDEILMGIQNDDILPICSTSFERTKYTFGYGDSIMEACFDVGEIKANHKSLNICELELELISGDVEDLQDMANYILDRTNAVPFNESKFKRTLRLMEESKES